MAHHMQGIVSFPFSSGKKAWVWSQRGASYWFCGEPEIVLRHPRMQRAVMSLISMSSKIYVRPPCDFAARLRRVIWSLCDRDSEHQDSALINQRTKTIKCEWCIGLSASKKPVRDFLSRRLYATANKRFQPIVRDLLFWMTITRW